jgi:hypothetical protein
VIAALLLAAGCPSPGGPTDDGGTTPAAVFQGVTGIVTTLVGNPSLSGSADTPCFTARYNQLGHIVNLGDDLFVADTGNHTIRRIALSTGAVTTLAGTAGASGSTNGTGSAARFNNPLGITCDADSVYVADTYNHVIRKIVISSGVVTTLAGSAGSSGSTDDIGANARFKSPEAVTSDGVNLYVADTGNHTIRKVVISTGAVTTLAGTALSVGSTDDTGSAARFSSPGGILFLGGSLYVSDTGNKTIRVVSAATGVVTTLAGSAGSTGFADGTGNAARFGEPHGLASSSVGMDQVLYVVDSMFSTVRRILVSTKEVTTVAGDHTAGGFLDGTGSAARFFGPWGVTRVGENLYIADGANYTLRKMVITSAQVTTISGTPLVTGSTDNTTAPGFNGTEGIASDGTYLYVMDAASSTLRRIELGTAYVKTLAGSAGSTGSSNGTGSTARFNFASDITYDGTNLYVTDTSNHTIRKVVPFTGAVTTFAGSAGVSGSSNSTDGTGGTARFYCPMGITNDGTNLYVADWGNSTIRKIVIATGEVSTLAGTAGITNSMDGTGASARFYEPRGLVRDGDALYVADTSNRTIRKIVISTGVVTTLAGTPGTTGSMDGTGTAAQFYEPQYITSDGTFLYVTDKMNQTIRKIVISTGVVMTLAGSTGVPGSSDGTGSGARFTYPRGIVSLGSKLYVSDCGSYAIRVIE